MTRRLGVFGGTFDPIHVAHLVLAEQAREQLSLDRVLFVPSATPPHKVGLERTPAKTRFEMVELAVAGHPAFAASDLEIRRVGPSYTVDTLKQLKDQHPDAELHLLLGGDSWLDFPNWRAPEEILSLAKLAVMLRDGSEKLVWPAGWNERRELPSVVEAPPIAISSTDLRRRVREGRSIRYFVPAAVDAFIAAHRLYRSE